jgi:hypothetical protein
MKSAGARARQKGLQFERDCANRFRLAGWTKAKRHLEFQQAEAQGFDLDATEPFRCQCKRYAQYAPISTLQEIKLIPGVVPVLITKSDEGRAVAVMPFDDFMRIIAAARAAGINLAVPTVNDF